MDKNAIKKYAVWARRELIERVAKKAQQFGIEKQNIVDGKADTINDKILTASEKRQRQALIARIEEKEKDGYEQVMEEVAYTWFNRFSALRFMEVNGYLPTHVRVFTDEENNFKPQILTEAIHLDMDGLDMEKVYAFKDANKTDELYKYLLITQCNALNSILPGMFQKIEDYTELLFPDNLLREGSVIEQMVALIPEKDFDIYSDGQVEIIGWLYQYYNDERKNEVININKTSMKKDDIPAATQLFTTDWVVRYIIDNSIGRYWIERNPTSSLKAELEFFVEPKDGYIPIINEKITPEDITVFDPCMGSAHFLIYGFEVLLKIYVEFGYSERDAVKLIVEKNLYGLDIDDRASQLAYFALMMKARQYDRRFFLKKIQPHVFAFQESINIDYKDEFVSFLLDEKHQKIFKYLLTVFTDAKEFGSLIQVEEHDYHGFLIAWEKCSDFIFDNILMMGWYWEVRDKVIALAHQAILLSTKYTVVATNPPYLNKFDVKLKEFVVENYKDYSGDLFSIFIFRNFGFCKSDGYSGFMTPFVWMFIKNYEKLRKYILGKKSILSLIQMEYSAFEEATVPICSFILKNGTGLTKGLYFKLSEFKGGMGIQREKVLEAITKIDCSYVYEMVEKDFCSIPGSPIAYWVSPKGAENYHKFSLLNKYVITKQGFKTGNNDRFLRLWFEIDYNKLSLDGGGGKKWYPCNKGGSYRKWFGNREYVVNWENDGKEICNYRDKTGKILSRPQNLNYNFREGLTWSSISSGPISLRYSGKEMMFESKGSGCFALDNCDILCVQAFLNSIIGMYYISALAPTLDYSEGALLKLPFDIKYNERLSSFAKQNIELCKNDWDAFEISWDFSKHPLVIRCGTKCNHISQHGDNVIVTVEETSSNYLLKSVFSLWKDECDSCFFQLKNNEEEINRIFIDIYGLHNELTPEVEDRYVTVNKADLQRDIKSLISYAVGCMFGRYSLDIDGLVFAGGKWDDSKYITYSADKDNIIPICDDEYFEDDITSRFMKFIEVVYGKNTLQENLNFIADALGGKGQPKEVIRSYFLNNFYKDHCKIYQKRPIYWQFDSGKKNGFKCLIYMHRYEPDTIARVRTDYVHEQQSRYRTAIEDLEQQIMNSSTSERVKLNKKLLNLQAQASEIKEYEEKIHHLADQMIRIDLDDGVKKNYEKFKDVLSKIN